VRLAPGRRVELADIVSAHAPGLREAVTLSPVQHQALRAIERCRTAALGGQMLRCEQCDQVQFRYHSCRNRHCPKCQALARERWLAARRAELLPVPYFHLVFTLPEQLRALCLGNPRTLYALLLRCAARTLQDFGGDSRWLGGEIAATLILHTWTQKLDYHPHVHALVAGGALSEDDRWIAARRGFLFPVHALSKQFRGKFLAALQALLTGNRLKLAGSTVGLADPAQRDRWLCRLRTIDWVVYAKPSLAGPTHVLDYLARYTHKVALSNERILGADERAVRLAWRDRVHGNRRRVLCLAPLQFLARYLRHVLPRGFTRIRHIGLLASRFKRSRLARARAALEAPAPEPPTLESAAAFCARVAGIDIDQCPACHRGPLRFVQTLAPTLAQRPRPP
jgi:hypothetical protein